MAIFYDGALISRGWLDPRGVETFGGVCGRHPDVHDDHVGALVTHQREQLDRIADLADHCETGAVQQAG